MADITDIIEREISLVSRFIQLLLDEQNCLKQSKPELLQQIATAKEPLIGALNQFEAERNKVLEATAGLNQQASMDSWLSQNAQNKNATVHWEKLLKMAREAKALHELNAQLINLHLTKTNAALSILTHNESGSRILYDNVGRSTPHTGSRIVDSA